MNIFELLLKKISEQRDRFQIGLVGGHVKDYAEYQHICGVLRGLSLMDEIVQDLAKRQKDADNE